MRTASILPWLLVLYFVQGIPAGIQRESLVLFMREGGASRTHIAYASALATPWLLKVFWAPWVDRLHLPRFGRRRSWLLPLQLLGVALLLAIGAAFDSGRLELVLALVLVLNLAMATMDVAVDGLAVESLRDDQLGIGNAAQVAGFKLGMLSAGGLVLQLLRVGSWSTVFTALAGVVALAFFYTLARDEQPITQPSSPAARVSATGSLRRTLLTPAGRWLVVLLLTYKAGESLADTQFNAFLYDSGFSAADIGLFAGVYGVVASTLGSVLGGLVAARARSLVVALFVVAAVRVLPQLGQTALAAFGATEPRVLVVTLAEHFAGGMLTTLVFALMMSSADTANAGTSFTALATVEVVGKGLAGFFSGHLADAHGDVLLFATSATLSTAFLALAWPMLGHAARGAYRRADVSTERPREANA